MFAGVLAVNRRGARASATAQLAAAAALCVLLLVTVAAALPEARGDALTPFAPQGWLAVGGAASLLMFSFVGWEAVTHLVGELRAPARDLPRAVAAALGVVAVLYLGLAVATVTVLGDDAGASAVPLADLAGRGLGDAGRQVTAAVAVLLTVGAMNVYVAGALQLARASGLPRPAGVLGLTGAGGLALLALGVGTVDGVVACCSACFVAVYVAGTAAGVRLLRGRARAAAAVSLTCVVVLLGFAGWAALVPVGVALVVAAVSLRA
jgi:amino acid efflux transporter